MLFQLSTTRGFSRLTNLLFVVLVLLCLSNQVALSAIDSSNTELPNAAAQAAFEAANKSFREHNYEETINHLDEVISKDPKFARAFYMRGGCKHNLEDFNGALADENKAIELEPNGNPIYYFQRGMTKYRLHLLDESIADSDIAIKREPDFYSTYLYRGKARWEKGDKKGALEDCNTILRLDPNNDTAMWFKVRIVSEPLYYVLTTLGNYGIPVIVLLGIISVCVGTVLCLKPNKRNYGIISVTGGIFLTVIGLCLPIVIPFIASVIAGTN
jgi:tetratricopeptide (TPR) repeat protein